MTEYAENTVGYHLNRLKEPLRSRAIEFYEGLEPEDRELVDSPAIGGKMYLARAFVRMEGVATFRNKRDRMFWSGAHQYFSNEYHNNDTFSRSKGNKTFKQGWDMAKECAPDPRTVTISVVATEKDSLGNPEVGPVIQKPDAKDFYTIKCGDAISFFPPTGDRIIARGLNTDADLPAIPDGYVDAPNAAFLTSQEILDLGENPIRVDLNSDTPLVPTSKSYRAGYTDYMNGESEYLKGRSAAKAVARNAFKEPAPKAVEGYEPPVPIETIEGRHDREIKELQQQNKDLQAKVEKLEAGLAALIDYVNETGGGSGEFTY